MPPVTASTESISALLVISEMKPCLFDTQRLARVLQVCMRVCPSDSILYQRLINTLKGADWRVGERPVEREDGLRRGQKCNRAEKKEGSE